MAEKRTRRRFTAEFKAEAVKRLLEGGRGPSEVAAELGLSPGQLSSWRNEHLAAGSAETLALRKAEEAEMLRLKRAERADHAVVALCRTVGASVSGFYAWLRAIPAAQNRAEAEAELRGHIGRLFSARRRVYGAPRLHAELRREGRRHSRRRVARLMREMGLTARRGRRRTPRTTDSRHSLPVAPNLLGRRFAAERPDAVWLADLSYIPTGEGFLYLAAIEAGPRRGPGRRARSSAGAWPTTCGRGCASTPCSWPCSAADPCGG